MMFVFPVCSLWLTVILSLSQRFTATCFTGQCQATCQRKSGRKPVSVVFEHTHREREKVYSVHVCVVWVPLRVILHMKCLVKVRSLNCSTVLAHFTLLSGPKAFWVLQLWFQLCQERLDICIFHHNRNQTHLTLAMALITEMWLFKYFQ